MVNIGHPSRACKLCRTRRIKCDETKPHCLKCQKTNRQCPGYRDAFDINLRDETQRTIRKAKAARATATQPIVKGHASARKSPQETAHSPLTQQGGNRGSPQALSETSWDTVSFISSPGLTLASVDKRGSLSPQDTSEVAGAGGAMTLADPHFDFNSPVGSTPLTTFQDTAKRLVKGFKVSFEGTTVRYGAGQHADLETTDAPLPLVRGLQTPLDQQATCYLLSNFVLTVSGDQGNSLFNFLLNMLKWDGIDETPFPMAFTAASIAAFAGRPNSRHLLPQSRVYYSTALVQLKQAIKDENRAKHDTSLAAAILLSFYEASPFQRLLHPMLKD